MKHLHKARQSLLISVIFWPEYISKGQGEDVHADINQSLSKQLVKRYIKMLTKLLGVY